MTKTNAIAPNANRLLWAGFTAILAAGVGFGVRGGIFANWAQEFNFSGVQLGAIGGAGFTGFCFGIVIGGVVVDKIGYGKLVLAAFLFHIISAFVTIGASEGMASATAYQLLFWGTFIFALANGTLEAVSNPLVATLYPDNRTHYLNILHASWPLGMVFGGLIGWTLGSGDNAWDWRWQLALYIVPTIAYGIMFLGQKYPKSEASEKGLKIGEMFKDVGLLSGGVVCFMLYLFTKGTLAPFFDEASNVPTMISALFAVVLLGIIGNITKFSIGHWLLFVLFIAHALIGAVELGTDGWIQNITGAILDPTQGKILFVITSLLMFGLRFCAHFIEKKVGLNPIGLLLVCSLLAVLGLNFVAAVNSFGAAVGALAVYAVGKTFFWPTMLAIVGDRFPATGAVAMSLMGGVGMMSAGLIGSPGLGYFKDRLAAEALQEKSPALYEEFKSDGDSSKFLAFEAVQPINPQTLEEAKTTKKAERSEAQQTIVDADIEGNRDTLRVDSFIPAAMAVIFLFLFLYFRKIGGYKPLSIEKLTGGVQGPVA
ncbi:MAG: MFS transporter [Akkermansiaceae bacterium]|jgi:MFS family permease|nr:MFS transporter [Akkermansiaceae bacterium]MDP4646630.1 MFS transporter [Akkermansiaceae bacterium]MDP4721038.1 MFS transporter [Akkermansiaceae bacterium]MDP4781622.1 MFS transporter [Akkermansiaceae bacterium]MDP4846374.1 MFS transporter [Akkermansiaceae bacterium]